MKPLIFTFVLFVLFVASAAAGDPGRFQLVAGSYGSGEDHRSTIIKIDTTTGEAWEMVVIPQITKGADGTKGRVEVSGWAPIPENAAAEIQRLRAAGVLPK